MGKGKKNRPKEVEAKYEPTEQERSVLDKQRSRRAAKLPAPRLKIGVKDGKRSGVLLRSCRPFWSVLHPPK